LFILGGGGEGGNKTNAKVKNAVFIIYCKPISL